MVSGSRQKHNNKRSPTHTHRYSLNFELQMTPPCDTTQGDIMMTLPKHLGSSPTHNMMSENAPPSGSRIQSVLTSSNSVTSQMSVPSQNVTSLPGSPVHSKQGKSGARTLLQRTLSFQGSRRKSGSKKLSRTSRSLTCDKLCNPELTAHGQSRTDDVELNTEMKTSVSSGNVKLRVKGDTENSKSGVKDILRRFSLKYRKKKGEENEDGRRRPRE